MAPFLGVNARQSQNCHIPLSVLLAISRRRAAMMDGHALDVVEVDQCGCNVFM